MMFNTHLGRKWDIIGEAVQTQHHVIMIVLEPAGID
jgi:hypothetical protein